MHLVMFNGDVTTSGSMTVGAITIPNTDGTSGQVLTTDGSGTSPGQTNQVERQLTCWGYCTRWKGILGR